ALPVIGVIVNAGVVAAVAGDHPRGHEHLVHVARVGDAGLVASVTGSGVAGVRGLPDEAARRADPPLLPQLAASRADVQSADPVPVATDVVRVAGGELTQRLPGRAAVLTHLAVILGVL